MMRYCQECFQLKNEWSSLKRERCSLLMLTRELINRGQLYVIKSIEHSDLHWSRSSLLLALCCSLVDESKTSILIQKKEKVEENPEEERTWVFPLQLPIHRAPLLDALHGSTQPWKQFQNGLRKILPLYLDHFEFFSNAPGSWRRSGPRSSCCSCLCPARPAASQGSSRTCRSRQSGSLRNHIRKFETLIGSCKMIRFSIESSYSGWECENAWLSPVQIVWKKIFFASPVAALLHVANM